LSRAFSLERKRERLACNYAEHQDLEIESISEKSIETIKLRGLMSYDVKNVQLILGVLDEDCKVSAVGNKDFNVTITSSLFRKEWFSSALMCSIGLIETLADYQCDFFQKHSYSSILSCVYVLLDVNTYEEYIDLIKYSTTWMHARSLKQVLPNAPGAFTGLPLLFTGSVRKLLKNRMIQKQSDHTQALFWSIAQNKRCAEVVPDEFIGNSLIKHRKAMDKVSDPVPEDLLESCSEKFDNIVSQINFRKVGTVNEYSTSACWEAPTVQGGAKAELLYQAVRTGLTSNDELLSMDYHPRRGVMERRGFVNVDIVDLMENNEEQMCKAKVYPICEPLKIRNITKSNAGMYAIAKGMQLDMHSSLKKFFQFRLTGAPCEVSDIEELVRRSPEGIFASGDFSAATDNVKIELTKLFFEKVLNSMLHHSTPHHTRNVRLVRYLRRVLYEHEIHYPTGYSITREQNSKLPIDQQYKGDLTKLATNNVPLVLPSVIQKNGQLMGSVLSFMVLCAINIAIYWHSVEPDVTDFRDLNVMVNGDDILFRTTQEKYDTWLGNLPKAGLLPSPGKNFFHDKFCTVNSALFSVRNNTVKYIPFFNAGMLLGQSKVCRTEFSDKYKSKPVHCLHSKVLHGANNPVRANSRFCYYNKDLLVKAVKHPSGYNMNYYMPRELGGLGMKVPNMSFINKEMVIKMTTEDKIRMIPFTVVTPVQLAIALTLHRKWTTPYLKPPMKPIGQEIDLDREDNNFVDTSNCDYHILIPDKMCPMPSYCRDKCSQSRPINWSAPAMDSPEMERLQYEMKGVHLRKTSYRGSPKYWKQINRGFPYVDFCNVSYKEYKWIGEQPVGLVDNGIQPYDEKKDFNNLVENLKVGYALERTALQQVVIQSYNELLSLYDELNYREDLVSKSTVKEGIHAF